MSDETKIFIECGLDSLANFASTETPCLLDQVARIKTEASSQNIDLHILFYSGIVSPFSGGREMVANGKEMNRSLSEVRQIVESLNAHGISFNLVQNGGLRLPVDIDERLLAAVDPVLSMLVASSRTHGVKNSVTITHPMLFDYISRKYSDLETTASCIQALYPFSRHDYGESFKKYDYVVLLNQHATPKFLEQYKEYSDKIIVFLTLGCGTSNLEKCYLHYFDIESGYAPSDKKASPMKSSMASPIRSQLAMKDYDCDSGDLLSRQDDLIGILLMQVNKFKIPRNGILKRASLLKLLYLINEHYPKLSC